MRTLIKLLLLRPVMHFLLLETDSLLYAASVFLRAAYSGYIPYIVKVSPVLLSLSLSTEIFGIHSRVSGLQMPLLPG